MLCSPPSWEESVEYLREEGILEYIEIGKKYTYNVFDYVSSDHTTPFFPDAYDLFRLHKLVRSRKVFNVLEFGLGYSTIIIADALKKNQDDFSEASDKPDIRISNPFAGYSVDSSEYWINEFKEKYNFLPFYNHINITYSKCEVGTFNGQICHFYKSIPNVVTDFIYLDGPDPNDVAGVINGITFKNCPERTVMSGDLLALESMFLPGTMILIDGRTNNARFLENNFKRKYGISYCEEQDVTTFELLEVPLGAINRNQINYCLGNAYYGRVKELC